MKYFLDALRLGPHLKTENREMESLLLNLFSEKSKKEKKMYIHNLNEIKCREKNSSLKALKISVNVLQEWQSQILRLVQHWMEVNEKQFLR